MHSLKRICVSITLVLLTAGIVLMPLFLSGQAEQRLLGETLYWKYDTPRSANLTSKQVAELYGKGQVQIYGGESVNVSDSLVADKENLRADIAELFDTVFTDNAVACDYMKEVLTDGALYYFKSSSLTIVDDAPVALGFVEVAVTRGEDSFAFTYEEKTRTLLQFSCYSYKTDEEDEYALHTALQETVKSYYERIGLTEGQYFYVYESEQKVEDHTYIGFGVTLHTKEEDVWFEDAD